MSNFDIKAKIIDHEGNKTRLSLLNELRLETFCYNLLEIIENCGLPPIGYKIAFNERIYTIVEVCIYPRKKLFDITLNT